MSPLPKIHDVRTDEELLEFIARALAGGSFESMSAGLIAEYRRDATRVFELVHLHILRKSAERLQPELNQCLHG